MRTSNPIPVGELLIGSRVLGRQTHRVTHQEWEQVVGVQLARRTQPDKIVKGALNVIVASSAWAQELSLLSATIIQRLNSRGRKVSRLRFSVGKPQTPRSPDAPVSHVARGPLPAGLLKALQHVEDPELRRVIAEAASYNVGSRGGTSQRR